MGENRDLGIKLFGRTIAQISDGHGCEVGKEAGESPHGDKSEKTPTPLTAGDFKDQQEDYNIQLTEEHENLLQKEGESETNTPGQEKVFKRPEKILPCPRCKSSDTKFCYFNNYNVNQPRHFCKNCQRYWTAGGTMRNVPIGAGRRKGKQFASQYRQMLASSDSLPPIRGDATEFVGQRFHMAGESKSSFRSPTGNEMVLKFGPEAPLCESMENALRLRDQEKCETVGSGNCGENGEELSSGSSITASSFKEADLKDKDQPNFRGPVTGLNLTPPPLPYTYHAPQWGFSWHPNWSMAPTIAPLRSSESIHVPEPTLPLQFVQASNWRCLPIYPVVSGNMILTASNSCTHSSPSTCDGAYNGNYSPALGKHSRDASLAEEERVEAGILVPKTLRVDDPYEASKSSIWSTLGIRADENDNAVRGLNVQGKEQGSDFIWVSEPNPTAVSCTRTFEEST